MGEPDVTGGRGHTALARRGVLRDHTAERKAGETYAPAEHQPTDAVGRLAAAVESLAEAVRPRINTWREP